MTKDEALKLALDALEVATTPLANDRQEVLRAQAAIREALALVNEVDQEQPAQPQQEPVAWTDLLKKADEIVRGKTVWKRFIDGTPLANDIAVWMADFVQQHTSPPAQRKPLTDEEIEKVWRRVQANDFHDCVQPFARAIEAKLKEKNSD